MEEAREACFHCREAIALDAKVCPHCRREVLADVHLQSPITDGRLRYKLARSLSAQSDLPLPPFTTLQQALGGQQKIVARRLTRAAAQQVVRALEAEGVAAWIEPARVAQVVSSARAEKPGGFPVMALVWTLVLLICMGGGGWIVWRVVKDAVSQPPGKPAETRVAASAPGKEGEPSREPALTTRQIAELGMSSTVSLRCSDSVASGFFVAPGTVLTNAHALCTQGAIRIVLSDGRKVAGNPTRIDKALDLATITVYELKGEAAPLGDAGALAVGEKVVMIGSPMGLEFTVHEGTISSLSRSIEGVAFIQLDAKINPGNSGGPLFDDRGRVVGIVSRKHSLAEGIGLALPINYAYRSVMPGARPKAGQANSKGFEAMVARAKAEEIDEGQAGGGELPERGLPMLVAVDADRRTRELVALVALPAQQRPEYRRLAFDVMVGTEVLCQVESDVYEWTLMEGNAALGRIHPRYLPGIRRRASLGTLYLGEARLSFNRCPEERLRWTKNIRMIGADPEFEALR